MIEKIKKTSEKKKILIFLFLIFITMLIMNFLTPLIADDYTYSFGLNNKKISNIGDIFIKQYYHYLKWGGRSVAHTIAQFFLMIGKNIFNIANSLIYCVMVYLIYLHSKLGEKDNSKIIIIINLLLWFMLPVFGQSCIWLIGSCNYMWTTVIILLFLLPFNKDSIKKDTWLITLGMFLLGIIAGWTNENTSFGLNAITIGLLALKKNRDKKYKFKKWQISGLIGSILGFIILIIAPGNFARNEYFKESTSFIVKIMKRAFNITNTFVIYVLPLIIMLIILLSIYYYKKKKVKFETYIYCIGGILTAYAMTLSPVFPERAWTGVIIFFIISICILLFNIEKIHSVFRYIMVDIIIVYSIIYINQYINACRSINELRNVWKYRVKVIEKAKRENKDEVYLSNYATDNSKNPNYNLDDIAEDPSIFPNKDIALYYGIKKVKKNK